MDSQRNILRFGIFGAIANIAGIVLSGPFGVVLVSLTHPNLGWVLTTPGLISYMVWNVLVLCLSIFFLLSLRKRLAQSSN